MKVIINTTDETIIIEEGTSEEIIKTLVDYPRYKIISKIIECAPMPLYPIQEQPFYKDIPFYVGDLTTIQCSDISGEEGFKHTITLKLKN